jgi:YgiT-type zinc finger domain-containing protein
MKCVICRLGETRPGKGTVTLTRDRLTLVFCDVPALICENCGEQTTDEKVTGRLLEAAEQAAQSGVQVEVRQYVAA